MHLAVGMFDGVHLGHQAVIETATQLAQATQGINAVLTFWPHPSRLFRPDNPEHMIMSPEIKVEVLRSHKVQYVIQQKFDLAFAAIEATDFVGHLKSFLPNLNSIHVGSNWRFGKGRAGDVQLLLQSCRKAGIHVISVERVNYDGQPISSTRIRNHLKAGEMKMANALLGDVYFSLGPAIQGNKLGREMGFPTLNLPWNSDLKPPYGVYCVEVEGECEGATITLPGVANFGLRPTVEKTTEPILEVHALRQCPFTHGSRLKVRWHHFLRTEKTFEGVESLRKQIALDVREARRYWGLT